ncbi:MAG: cytochrome [Hyphomicrobiales bacterium]|nr:MAG: cytochrome [Hyphomicrobiales bacterium]
METAPETILKSFDLRDLPTSFYDNPFPTYHMARREQPVFHLPDEGGIFLTRFKDLDRVYKDTAIFSSDKNIDFKPKFGDSPLFDHHTSTLVFNDAPLHTRVRKTIVGALAPRALKPLGPQIENYVDEILTGINEGDVFDAVDDYASLLPIRVIGDMLSVPEDERDPLRNWSLLILGALEPKISDEQFIKGNEAVSEFLQYLEEIVARRKIEMNDDDDDLLARLIRVVEGNDGLLHHELLQNCIFLLNAGHETTTNLISSGLLTLSRLPEVIRELNDDPSLWGKAVEEILRLESPNQLGNRRAVVEFEIDGQTFPKGTPVTLCIGAANRDPDVFDQPDNFILDRGRFTHFAFAGGPHLCAGLTVARIEGRIALSKIFEKFPNLHVDGTIKRARRARFRGFDYLPMKAAR